MLFVAIPFTLLPTWLFFTQQEAASARQFHQEAQAKIDRLKHKQRETAIEDQERQTLAIRYQTLLSSPANTPFNPVSRAERVHKIHQALSLHDVKYELHPPVPDAESPNFLRQTLKIEIHLRHEGELLRFFDALHVQPHALSIIRHCRLSRLEAGLSAACEIDQYHLSGIPSP